MIAWRFSLHESCIATFTRRNGPVCPRAIHGEMTLIQVGTLKELWRYPVKGMAGETVHACTLGEQGIPGDRIWALRDQARAEIQSCKTRPDLLRCVARSRGDGHVEITLPDGMVIASDEPRVHAALTALIGRESSLEALRPAADYDFFRRHKRDAHTWIEELAATFEREPGEPLPDLALLPPPLVDCVSMPGSFFLVTPLHFVTTASLAHLTALNPAADWDTRRFRPNVVIETVPDLAGLVEQAWIGRRIVIGGATMDCVGATPRCGAVTRAQAGLAADTGLLRTVVREADQNVGVYGVSVTAGAVRVGDAVYID